MKKFKCPDWAKCQSCNKKFEYDEMFTAFNDKPLCAKCVKKDEYTPKIDLKDVDPNNKEIGYIFRESEPWLSLHWLENLRRDRDEEKE